MFQIDKCFYVFKQKKKKKKQNTEDKKTHVLPMIQLSQKS